MSAKKFDLKGRKLSELNSDEMQRLQTEYELYQSMYASKRPTPYLPSFTGDSKGADYQYLRDAVTCLQTQGYDEHIILQTIRKSTCGSVVKVISCLPYSSSVDKILEGLDVSYGALQNDAVNWQRFYNARQTKSETSVEWNVRLRELWKRAPTSSMEDSDKIIKSQFWMGLQSTDIKNACRHLKDDSKKSASDILLYIRGLDDDITPPTTSRQVMPVIEGATSEVNEMRKELAELKLMMKQQLNKQENKSTPPANYDNRYQQQQQMRQRRIYTCYRCGRQGHVQKYCRATLPASTRMPTYNRQQYQQPPTSGNKEG